MEEEKIGYSPEACNACLTKIETIMGSMHGSIPTHWAVVQDFMRKHWTGVDECDNEVILANLLDELWKEGYKAAGTYQYNLRAIAKYWQEFQEKNTADGGSAAGKYDVTPINEASLYGKTAPDIDWGMGALNELRGKPQAISVKGGLEIKDKIDEFQRNVKKLPEELKSLMDGQITGEDGATIGRAFEGQEQTPKLQEMCKQMGELIGNIVTACTALKNKIDECVQNYGTTDSAVAEAVAGHVQSEAAAASQIAEAAKTSEDV